MGSSTLGAENEARQDLAPNALDAPASDGESSSISAGAEGAFSRMMRPWLLPVVVLIPVIVWCLYVQGWTPLLGAALAAVALALRDRPAQYAVALAVVGVFALLLLQLWLGTFWSGFTSQISVVVVLTALTVVGLVASIRPGLPGWPRFANWSWGALVGPIILALTIAYMGLKWGPMPAWAMAGDGRNHYLIMESIEAAGGWLPTVRGYPATFNAVASVLIGGDPAELPVGDQVIAKAQVMAQLLLLTLLLVGLLAGLIAAGHGSSNAKNLRAGMGSLICVAPILLAQTLGEGFLPVPLAVLLGLAGITLAARPNVPVLLGLGVTAVSMLLVYSVQPAQAVLPPIAWLIALISRVSSARLRILLYGLAAPVVVGAIMAALQISLSNPNGISQIGMSGAIGSFDIRLVLVPAFVALISLLAYWGWKQLQLATTVILGCLSVWVMTNWMVDLVGFQSYYASKTLWIGTLILIPFSLGRAEGALRDGIWRAIAPILVVLVLTWRPNPLWFAPRFDALNILAKGWTQVSASEARILPSLGNENPTLLWKMYGPDTDRRLNFWAIVAFKKSEEQYATSNYDQLQAWAYNASPEDAAAFCWIFEEYPQAQALSDDPEEAAELIDTCGLSPDRVVTPSQLPVPTG
jgi:hypothetical protein